MPFQYHDEKIPQRPSQGGRNSRSVFDAGSRWRFVTQEELFSGYGRTRQDTNVPEKESDRFSAFLRMTRAYQVTDNGRRKAFLEQAKWMESYEEDSAVSQVEFYHQYVGYQEMDVWELHGYFAWRTRFRRGETVPYCFEYIRLHAAELIHLIGVKDQKEAFDRLLLLQAGAISRKNLQAGAISRRDLQPGESAYGSGGQRYGRSIFAGSTFSKGAAWISQTDQKKISGYLAGFLIAWTAESCDKPDPELLQAYCIPNLEREAQNVTLLHYMKSDDAAIDRMIRQIVPGRVLNSEFLRQAGEDGWRVIARVFRRVCLKQKQAGSPVLAERLLGPRRNLQRDLFPMTPYETHAKEGSCVEISEATSYSFREGRWYRSEYAFLRDEGAVRELSDLVRECERVLRKKLHYRNQLPDRMKNPVLAQLIASETDRWLKEKALRSRPEVHVDLTRLGAIREMAAITRERLLEGTEEGMEADALRAMMNGPERNVQEPPSGMSAEENTEEAKKEKEHTVEADDTDSAQPESADASVEGFFNALEADFLKQLLEGDSGAAFFQEHKILPSVFVDAINEKAFDEIGDVIVEEGGGGWQLVEDYLGEIADLLNRM